MGVDLSFAKSIIAGVGLERAMERFGGVNFWKSNYSTAFSVNTSRRISVEGDFAWGGGVFFSATPFLGRSRNGLVLSSIRPFSRLQADLRLDFSHLDNPMPGAEVFDFGETLVERFLLADRRQRTNRAFFAKFSYLFRY